MAGGRASESEQAILNSDNSKAQDSYSSWRMRYYASLYGGIFAATIGAGGLAVDYAKDHTIGDLEYLHVGTGAVTLGALVVFAVAALVRPRAAAKASATNKAMWKGVFGDDFKG